MRLGVDKRTGQYIIHDPLMGGLRYARTIVSMPEPQRWSIDAVQNVNVSPWSTYVSEAPRVIHHQQDTPPEARGGSPPDRLAQVRRLYIRQSDLDSHGYTQDCPRCQHIIIYGAKQTSINHSEQCRSRIMEAISRTPEGQARIQKMMAKATNT